MKQNNDGKKISEDLRIDKRIKDVFGFLEVDSVTTGHATREEMMALRKLKKP